MVFQLTCLKLIIMTAHSKAFDDIIDFMLAGKTPEEIIAFKASKATNKRISYLLQQEKDAVISPEEKSELDYYMLLEHIVVLAKAKALDLTT
jgi:hypothetical protein